jgi:hypothetical protein
MRSREINYGVYELIKKVLIIDLKFPRQCVEIILLNLDAAQRNKHCNGIQM